LFPKLCAKPFPTNTDRRSGKENNAARAELARVRRGVVLLGRRQSRRGGGETNTAHRRSGGKVNSSCDGGYITPIFKSFWSSKNLFSKRFLVGCGATPCKKSSLAVREAEPRNALGGCRAGSCEKRALVKYIVLLRDMLKCAINESAHVVVRKAVHHRLALTLESDKTRALQYS